MLCVAEISIKRPAQVVHTERVDFASGGTIRLNDSFGHLYIEGWDQPAVEMTLIREMMDYDVPKGVSERMDRVLELLETRETVTVSELAESFAVSEVTVRSDLSAC